MEDINCLSDRCTLELLNKKQYLSFLQERQLKRLKRRYSNYKSYEKKIIDRLMAEGFIDEMGIKDTIYVQETGEWVPADGTGEWHKQEDIYYLTNGKGLVALKTGYFPSDYWDNIFKTKLARTLTVVGVLGGITALIKEVLSLFK